MNMLHLTVEENGRELSQVDLGPDKILTIGRGEDNDLVLKSKNVSMFHCKIIGSGDSWSLKDLGSTNGVKVNGKKVQEQILSHGDELEIHPFVLRVSLPTPGSDRVMEEENTVIDTVSSVGWEDKTVLSTVAIPGGAAGAAVAGGPAGKNFIVVKSGPAAGLSIPIHDRVTIGRGEGCDLTLEDSFMSREHVLITLQKGVCRFQNLADNNPVKLNTKKLAEGVLKDGSVLMIGQTELKMRLEGGGGVSALKNMPSGIRILLLGALFVLMLFALIAVLKDDKVEDVAPVAKVAEQTAPSEQTPSAVQSEESKVSKESAESEPDFLKNVTLEQKRQRSLFLYQAKQFAREGLLEKAANRLEASLEVVPKDQEAMELLTGLREQIREKEKKESDRAALVEKVRTQIENDLALVEESLQRQAFIEALDLLEKISVKQPDFPELEEQFTKVEKTFEKVKDAQTAAVKVEENRQKILEQQVVQVQEIYRRGWQAYKGNKYSEARQHWEQVVASNLDIPERRQAQFYLDKLKTFLEDRTQSDYLKGLESFNRKDYPGALLHWNNVLKIYPNHPDIKPKVDQFLSSQEEKAKHLYQEGLVYEGINNIDQAVKNWKQVLVELPLENSRYHQKAKEKLSEYGRK